MSGQLRLCKPARILLEAGGAAAGRRGRTETRSEEHRMLGAAPTRHALADVDLLTVDEPTSLVKSAKPELPTYGHNVILFALQ